MERTRGSRKARMPQMQTIHEDEEMQQQNQDKILLERMKRTDANGNETEVSRYRVRKAAKAEVQFDAKQPIPQGYQDSGIKYGHTAPYGVERSPISGKNSLYQRKNDPRSVNRYGRVLVKEAPIDMKGKTMGNMSLGDDVGMSNRMKQQMQDFTQRLINNFLRNQPTPPEVVERIRELSVEQQEEIRENVEYEIKRARTRSMSRDVADQPPLPAALPPPVKRLTIGGHFKADIFREVLLKEPTALSKVQGMIEYDRVGDTKDNVDRAAQKMGMSGVTPIFNEWRTFFWPPKLGTQCVTAKRGRDEVGTVINQGADNKMGATRPTDPGFGLRPWVLVRFEDGTEEKVYQDQKEYGWQTKDGPKPWNRVKELFDGKFDQALEFRDGKDPLEGYEGDRELTELIKLGTALEKDPIQGEKLVMGWQKLTGKLPDWTPSSTPTSDVIHTLQEHMRAKLDRDINASRHQDVTGAPSTDEVRRAALLAAALEPVTEEEKEYMGIGSKGTKRRFKQSMRERQIVYGADRARARGSAPMREAATGRAPGRARMPNADSSSSKRNGAIPAPALPLEGAMVDDDDEWEDKEETAYVLGGKKPSPYNRPAGQAPALSNLEALIQQHNESLRVRKKRPEDEEVWGRGLEMKPGQRGMSQMRERIERGSTNVGTAKDLKKGVPLSDEFRDVSDIVDDIKARTARVQVSEPHYRRTLAEMKQLDDKELKKQLAKRKMRSLKASDAQKKLLLAEEKAIADEIKNRKRIMAAVKNKQRQKKKAEESGLLEDRIGKAEALDVAKKHVKKNHNYEYYHELLKAQDAEKAAAEAETVDYSDRDIEFRRRRERSAAMREGRAVAPVTPSQLHKKKVPQRKEKGPDYSDKDIEFRRRREFSAARRMPENSGKTDEQLMAELSAERSKLLKPKAPKAQAKKKKKKPEPEPEPEVVDAPPPAPKPKPAPIELSEMMNRIKPKPKVSEKHKQILKEEEQFKQAMEHLEGEGSDDPRAKRRRYTVRTKLHTLFGEHARDHIRKEAYLKDLSKAKQTTVVDLIGDKLSSLMDNARNMTMDQVVDAAVDGSGFDATGLTPHQMIDVKKLIKGYLMTMPGHKFAEDHSHDSTGEMMAHAAKLHAEKVAGEVTIEPKKVEPAATLEETMRAADAASVKANVKMAKAIQRSKHGREALISSRTRGIRKGSAVHPPSIRPGHSRHVEAAKETLDSLSNPAYESLVGPGFNEKEYYDLDKRLHAESNPITKAALIKAFVPIGRMWASLRRAHMRLNPADAHHKVTADYIKKVQEFDAQFKELRALASKTSPLHNQQALPLSGSSGRTDGDLQREDIVIFDRTDDHEAGSGIIKGINSTSYSVEMHGSNKTIILPREDAMPLLEKGQAQMRGLFKRDVVPGDVLTMLVPSDGKMKKVTGIAAPPPKGQFDKPIPKNQRTIFVPEEKIWYSSNRYRIREEDWIKKNRPQYMKGKLDLKPFEASARIAKKRNALELFGWASDSHQAPVAALPEVVAEAANAVRTAQQANSGEAGTKVRPQTKQQTVTQHLKKDNSGAAAIINAAEVNAGYRNALVRQLKDHQDQLTRDTRMRVQAQLNRMQQQERQLVNILQKQIQVQTQTNNMAMMRAQHVGNQRARQAMGSHAANEDLHRDQSAHLVARDKYAARAQNFHGHQPRVLGAQEKQVFDGILKSLNNQAQPDSVEMIRQLVTEHPAEMTSALQRMKTMTSGKHAYIDGVAKELHGNKTFNKPRLKKLLDTALNGKHAVQVGDGDSDLSHGNRLRNGPSVPKHTLPSPRKRKRGAPLTMPTLPHRHHANNLQKNKKRQSVADKVSSAINRAVAAHPPVRPKTKPRAPKSKAQSPSPPLSGFLTADQEAARIAKRDAEYEKRAAKKRREAPLEKAKKQQKEKAAYESKYGKGSWDLIPEVDKARKARLAAEKTSDIVAPIIRTYTRTKGTERKVVTHESILPLKGAELEQKWREYDAHVKRHGKPPPLLDPSKQQTEWTITRPEDNAKIIIPSLGKPSQALIDAHWAKHDHAHPKVSSTRKNPVTKAVLQKEADKLQKKWSLGPIKPLAPSNISQSLHQNIFSTRSRVEPVATANLPASTSIGLSAVAPSGLQQLNKRAINKAKKAPSLTPLSSSASKQNLPKAVTNPQVPILQAPQAPKTDSAAILEEQTVFLPAEPMDPPVMVGRSVSSSMSAPLDFAGSRSRTRSPSLSRGKRKRSGEFTQPSLSVSNKMASVPSAAHVQNKPTDVHSAAAAAIHVSDQPHSVQGMLPAITERAQRANAAIAAKRKKKLVYPAWIPGLLMDERDAEMTSRLRTILGSQGRAQLQHRDEFAEIYGINMADGSRDAEAIKTHAHALFHNWRKKPEEVTYQEQKQFYDHMYKTTKANAYGEWKKWARRFSEETALRMADELAAIGHDRGIREQYEAEQAQPLPPLMQVGAQDPFAEDEEFQNKIPWLTDYLKKHPRADESEIYGQYLLAGGKQKDFLYDYQRASADVFGDGVSRPLITSIPGVKYKHVKRLGLIKTMRGGGREKPADRKPVAAPSAPHRAKNTVRAGGPANYKDSTAAWFDNTESAIYKALQDQTYAPADASDAVKKSLKALFQIYAPLKGNNRPDIQFKFSKKLGIDQTTLNYLYQMDFLNYKNGKFMQRSDIDAKILPHVRGMHQTFKGKPLNEKHALAPLPKPGQTAAKARSPAAGAKAPNYDETGFDLQLGNYNAVYAGDAKYNELGAQKKHMYDGDHYAKGMSFGDDVVGAEEADNMFKFKVSKDTNKHDRHGGFQASMFDFIKSAFEAVEEEEDDALIIGARALHWGFIQSRLFTPEMVNAGRKAGKSEPVFITGAYKGKTANEALDEFLDTKRDGVDQTHRDFFKDMLKNYPKLINPPKEDNWSNAELGRLRAFVNKINGQQAKAKAEPAPPQRRRRNPQALDGSSAGDDSKQQVVDDDQGQRQGQGVTGSSSGQNVLQGVTGSSSGQNLNLGNVKNISGGLGANVDVSGGQNQQQIHGGQGNILDPDVKLRLTVSGGQKQRRIQSGKGIDTNVGQRIHGNIGTGDGEDEGQDVNSGRRLQGASGRRSGRRGGRRRRGRLQGRSSHRGGPGPDDSDDGDLELDIYGQIIRMGGGGGNPLIPLGQHHANVMTHQEVVIPNDPTWTPPNLPMFRYGAPQDIVSDVIEVGQKVWIKVFSNLVEMICLQGVTEDQIAFGCWLIHHVDGPLLVNLPTHNDPDALKHLMDVSDHTRIRQMTQVILRQLVRYPTHFVIKSDYRLGPDNILAGTEIREHLDEYYQTVSLEYHEGRI